MHVYKMDSGHSGKIGVKEMFIAAITKYTDGKYQDIDDNILVDFDNIYNNHCIQELQNIIETKNFSSISVEESLPLLSLPELKNIIGVLKTKVVNF